MLVYCSRHKYKNVLYYIVNLGIIHDTLHICQLVEDAITFKFEYKCNCTTSRVAKSGALSVLRRH